MTKTSDLVLALAAFGIVLPSSTHAQTTLRIEDEPAAPRRGLITREKDAFDGLTIVAPINSKKVHLVEMDGSVVHTWETAHAPGAWLELLPNGHLLRSGRKEENPRFRGGGLGGLLHEIAWDGSIVWEFELANDRRTLHHDLEVLPNGNVLVIAWENHSREEALARGRDASEVHEVGFWPDVVLEVKPIRPKGGEIVWEWRAWDHLVQDRDAKKPNFGAPREHAGRIDVNADHRYDETETEEAKRKRLDREKKMRALGYTGDDDTPPDAPPPEKKPSGDWMHTNSVAHLASEDLIVLSSPHLCEIFVIDHSTTTAEAATDRGGKRGRGGELLWRYGNPQNYGAGTRDDRTLFYQHDPSWIASAKDGELRVLVFNNGEGRRPKDFSSVDELVLPFDREKGFVRDAGAPFGPTSPAWSYSEPEAFFSGFISGAQRLPNGNTLVCEGADGRVFEVTPDKRVVWDYESPLGGEIEPSPIAGKAPPNALFRAVRVPRSHPGLAGKL